MAAAEAQVFRTAVQTFRRMQRTRTGSSRAVSSSRPSGQNRTLSFTSRSYLPEPDRAACARLLGEAVVRVYPLVAPDGVPLPQVKLRKMRSQWGNCHYQQGYITLNTALARCPEPLRDYVALHELVHFLHHDHGTGFYAAMDARMPDWRARRQELKGYAQAIVE